MMGVYLDALLTETKPPHEVYISKPQEEGLKILTRMDTNGVHNLLLVDTDLSNREIDTFISELMRIGVATTTKCKDIGFILIIVNKRRSDGG